MADSEGHAYRSSRFYNLWRLDISSLFNRPGLRPGENRCPLPVQGFIYRLLSIISDDPFSPSIENVPVVCPTSADDLTLLALSPSFLQHLMGIVFGFSIKWRYKFNHIKSGVVVFGESKIQHAKNLMSREFNLGFDVVKERKEYKNLEVTKNYAYSCGGNINGAVKKTRRKGGMILSMGFDRKKVNPLIYIELIWKITCLPSLVFGSELWSLTKTDTACLERCQNWFIRKVFNLPKFSSYLLLLKISSLISVENEIAKRKLFFFARMVLAFFWEVFSGGGGGGQNLLLSKFLLLCYCFRTKFQGRAKVSRGRPIPPVEENQWHRVPPILYSVNLFRLASGAF